MVYQDKLTIHTLGRGTHDITAQITTSVKKSKFNTSLCQLFLKLPATQRHLALDTWQGIYLWEHRTSAFERHIIITVIGE